MRVGLLISLLTVVVLAAGCSSHRNSAHPAAAGAVISLKSLMFNPADLTIKVGTTVTWRNDEPITHTVTSGAVAGIDKTSHLRSSQTPDGLFNAQLKGNGDTFSYTFAKPGTYSYYCDIHQGMNATVTVTS